MKNKRQTILRTLPLLIALVAITVVGWRARGLSAESLLDSITSVVHMPIVSVSISYPPELTTELFATGFETDTITDIANAGDGRLFVAMRHGEVSVVQPDGTVLPNSFLRIHDDVSDGNWEEGMLGLVFHPDYPATPHVFVSYTTADFNLKVDRFVVPATTPNQADKSSRHNIISIRKVRTSGTLYRVHNGGDMVFGPDGMFYIGLGDGGPDPVNGFEGDPDNNGQDTAKLWGKMLRLDLTANGLDPDCGEGGQNYTIPADNPYVGADGCDEIYAVGLRNPWRFSFDYSSGDMWIADVGEAQREEINFVEAGTDPSTLNFGWHCWEGTFDYTTKQPELSPQCDATGPFHFPIYEHRYSDNIGCSMVGGFIYRGSEIPDQEGRYLFGDFCNGRMWTLTRDGNTVVSTPHLGVGFHISTFGEGHDGEIYVGQFTGDLDEKNNSIYKIVESP